MSAVGRVTWLLVATALATAAAEVLNWWYAADGGWTLFVRTGWALVRALGFLLLIWHVRRARPAAVPLGIVLSVTTIAALARLVVPRHGLPALPGLAGFAVVAALCLAVLWQLHRSPGLRAHLAAGEGRRAGVPGRLVTARVAALAYGPLTLVAALIALGETVPARPETLPVALGWLAAGFALNWAVLPISFFLVRGHRWPRTALTLLTGAVLALQLSLCWWLLGADGLVRDGTPVVLAAALVVWGLRPARPRPRPTAA